MGDFVKTKLKKNKYESFLSNTIKLVYDKEFKSFDLPYLVGLLCKCFTPPPPSKTFVYPKVLLHTQIKVAGPFSRLLCSNSFNASHLNKTVRLYSRQ